MTGLVAREDRLKRFTATSHAGDFSVMGRTVRLETTSLPALRHARRAMEPCGSAFSPAPRFFVRIVSEAAGGGAAERGKRRFFAAEGLWLEHLGARCFFAIDTDACMAVAYAPDDLAASEAAFTHAFLGPLLDRIASALGLTAVPAACLVIEGRGVLLFGSESDRLAVSHLTAKLGLEICSHQATFLELDGNALLAWRRAWSAPAEAEEFSPIPRRNASAHRPEADIVGVCRPVSPVFSVFLEGESSDVPRLIPLSSQAAGERLEDFQGAAGCEPGNPCRESIRSALGRLPAYRLIYGPDGATAAVFIHSLLKTNALLEARR